MADMEQEHTQPEAPANTQNLVDLGTSLIQREEGRVYVLTIVGQIEGHQLLPSGMKSTKYEHVLPLLAAVEGDPDIHGLLILLNNAGGDVEAGLAIAELIASMSKPTASLVLGGSHSIGVPLAVAARRSFIAPSAAMTVHPVRLTGLVIGAPPDFLLLRAGAGAHRPLRHRKQPHLPGGPDPADAAHRRAGRRRGQHPLWGGGGAAGPHRPTGRPDRRPELAVSDHRRKENAVKHIAQRSRSFSQEKPPGHFLHSVSFFAGESVVK